MINDKKNENAQKAIDWNNKMEEKYGRDITLSISKSTVWDESPNLIPPAANTKPEIKIWNCDTVSAILKADGKIAAMNFASYKNPGGNFLSGSIAQEESLCHASTLYPVLKTFDDTFYKYNRQHLNRSLYNDRLLYSKDILFFDKTQNMKMKKADVITCSAPNIGVFDQYYAHDDTINRTMISMRFRLAYRVAAYFKADTFITGAWGCGVFRQKPEEVAEEMKKIIEHEPGYFKTVIIAIPGGHNLDAFKKVFEPPKQPWEK